jgi:hypothetical protein
VLWVIWTSGEGQSWFGPWTTFGSGCATIHSSQFHSSFYTLKKRHVLWTGWGPLIILMEACSAEGRLCLDRFLLFSLNFVQILKWPLNFLLKCPDQWTSPVGTCFFSSRRARKNCPSVYSIIFLLQETSEYILASCYMHSNTAAMSISGLSVIPQSNLSGRLNKPWEPLAIICPDSEQSILAPRPKFCLDHKQASIGIIRGPIGWYNNIIFMQHYTFMKAPH